MPSVLVADNTEGRSSEMVLVDLAVLGGGLICLYLINNWLEGTEPIMAEGIAKDWGCVLQRNLWRLTMPILKGRISLKNTGRWRAVICGKGNIAPTF